VAKDPNLRGLGPINIEYIVKLRLLATIHDASMKEMNERAIDEYYERLVTSQGSDPAAILAEYTKNLSKGKK